jgi:hypothetical protein
MAINIKLQLYRGTLAGLQSLATTGAAGLLAWTTDSNELYVDLGSGSPGIGPGKAWQRVTPDNAYFTAANQSAMVALNAQIGDFADRTDLHQLWMLTAFPASTAGNWTAIAPDASITGIVGLSSPTLHEFVTYVDTSGVQHLAQPAFTDISGSLAQTQLPTTIGSGSSLTSIDLGTF